MSDAGTGLQLREGAFYRDGTGDVMGPMKRLQNLSETAAYVFECEATENTYTAEGVYEIGQVRNGLDLVEEVPDPNAPPVEDAFQPGPDTNEDDGPAWLPRRLTVGVWWESFGLIIAAVEVSKRSGVEILPSYVEVDEKAIDVTPLALDTTAMKRASGKFVTLRELIEARAREEAWA